MKIRVELQTDALASLYTGLTSVASGDTAREIGREASAEIQGFIHDQFASGTDPYGKGWTPPKDGGKPGVRSGKLRGAAQAVPLGPRIQLRASGVPYARFFAGGTSKMVARPIFPDGRGIPAPWKRAIENAARRVIARKLRKGR